MSRLLRILTVGILLSYAAPVLAQSFEGLDLSSDTKKKKKRKKRTNKEKEKEESTGTEATGTTGTEAAPATTTPPPAETAPAATPPATTPAPTGGATQLPGLDLSAPAKEQPSTEGLGLDLSGTPAKKGKGKGDKGEKTAPTMQFEGLDVSGKTADRQKLDIAVNLFKGNQYEQASLAAYELVQDPKFVEMQPEAQYLLAKSLYRMGLYHSSLVQFSKILARGSEGKFFKTSLEWLFFISRKTVNESVVLDEIAKYSDQEFPDKFKSEFHYLLARYHFVRGHALDRADQKQEADKSFQEVIRITAGISRTDPFYARAKYLEGLSYFRNATRDSNGRPDDPNLKNAVEDMREVARVTRPGQGKSAAEARSDEDMRELALMQLARIHYGARQNRKAIYYYSKVARGNESWLEALFESSWANYRIGQFEQALGNLITLSSPFFRDEYFPEALILKAVIYYENCRYRESTAILEDFERIYLPVHDQLELLVKKDMDAAEYYGVLADVQKKNKEGVKPNATEAILERILRLALTDQDLKKTNDSILELEGELDSYGRRSDSFKYSELSKQLMEELKQQRQELIKKAGLMARAKLERELGELKKLLANALRIKFETTTKEKEFLEEQLRAGGAKEIVKKYRFSVAVADEELYWPFEGEYWRDELGTYQYTLTKGCVDRDTANRSAGEGM